MRSAAIVANDAGAANLLFAYIKYSQDFGDFYKIYPVLSGPAISLWQQHFPDRPIFSSLQDIPVGIDCLVTGTGWASDFEHTARKWARFHSIETIAVVDHWINYQDRFVRDEEVCYPDKIWVFDNYARELAEQIFLDIPIIQKTNFFWMSQRTYVEDNIEFDYLYISEPARSSWGKSVQGEFQALEYFFSWLNQNYSSNEVSVLFRLHPSESPEKYQDYLSSKTTPNIHIFFDNFIHLGQSVGASKVVVGCSSAALAFAAFVDKPVLSVLPPNAPPCPLPHKEIIHLRDISSDEILHKLLAT